MSNRTSLYCHNIVFINMMWPWSKSSLDACVYIMVELENIFCFEIPK